MTYATTLEACLVRGGKGGEGYSYFVRLYPRQLNTRRPPQETEHGFHGSILLLFLIIIFGAGGRRLRWFKKQVMHFVDPRFFVHLPLYVTCGGWRLNARYSRNMRAIRHCKVVTHYISLHFPHECECPLCPADFCPPPLPPGTINNRFLLK